VVILGDLIDDSRASHAIRDSEAIGQVLDRCGLPWIAVRGNHDLPHASFATAIGPDRGTAEMGGYRFVWFGDDYDANDRTARTPEQLENLGSNGNIIALQHNPVFEIIEDPYPYMLGNRNAVVEAYEQAGVILSLSGHYHAGQGPSSWRGVTYVTAPALCEAPFNYLVVQITGIDVKVEKKALSVGGLNLTDHHCHTHFAYCAEDITAETVIERSQLLGVHKQFLTEHAPQLYMSNDAFWAGDFLNDPDIWLRNRTGPECRMDAYRAEVFALRSERVALGLELELDGLGRLMICDQDREGLNVLLGAVHFLPALSSKSPDTKKVEREFMKTSEGLLRQGVNILAHPFRVFQRAHLPEPTHLFRPMAEMLRSYGVAAELNFHVNAPERAFFEMCVELGVPISLGTDGHAMKQVANLRPHVEFLQEMVPDDRVGSLLLA
jgi:histidinol phosphatase-like PHP family hydrolase